MTEMDRRDNAWSIDKRIPISVIIMLVFQSAAVVMWGATMQSRVEHLEKAQSEQTSKSQVHNLPERITRLEVEQRYTTLLLQDVSKDVKALREKQ